MKSILLLIILVFTKLIGISQNIVKEGTINYQKYFTGFKDTLALPMFHDMNNKIWFKDSCVIFEIKQWTIKSNSRGKDAEEFHQSYDLFKYTFLDLRTLRCQDYYSLSDTASPKCNYILGKCEGVLWNFYDRNCPLNLKGKLIKMNDTVIKGKKFKMVKLRNEWQSGSFSEYRYYMAKDVNPSMFHINVDIDDKYPGYKATRCDMQGDMNEPLILTTQLVLLTDYLTESERLVFKKWEENARNITTPPLTFKEALNNCGPPIMEIQK